MPRNIGAETSTIMASNDVVFLKDLCLLTVGNYLSPSNVWSIYRLVPYVHCKRIEHIVHSFICDNFMDISLTHQFLALDEKEIQWLVDNEEIVASEAAVFDGLARWYKHSEHQRENAFKQLFDRVHVSVIERDALSEVITKYKLYKVIPDLRKYKVSKFLSRRVDMDELIYEENISNIALLNFMLHLDSGFINCWMPLLSKNTTINLKQMEEDLHLGLGSYIVPCRESVFIFGSAERARDDGPCMEQVNICVDLHSRTLEHRSPPTMCLPVKALTVTCGMFVFLLGGRKSTDALSTVYRYDTVADKWNEAASMVYGHAQKHKLAVELVLSYNNRYLFVFGQHCEKYDMYSNSWTPVVPPWERGVYCHNGHIFNDKIYIFVIPREQPVYRCFMYDIGNNTWQEPCTQVPYCFTTISFFGKRFALLKEKASRAMRRANTRQSTATTIRFAELKLEEGKFKLCSIKEFGSTVTEIFHIVVMSRRMRKLIEQKEKEEWNSPSAQDQ